MNKISLLVTCSLFMATTTTAQNPCPRIIPALQEWKSGQGVLNLSSDVFIVTNGNAEVEQIGSVLAQDLATERKIKSEFIIRPTPQTNRHKTRIYMEIAPDDTIHGPESYRMRIDEAAIVITAPTRQGIFWGTRTLMQMIHTLGTTLPQGEITDFPSYEKRGFMLDTGRKFFSLQYLQDYIKILSYYKMNEFQIHLNDNGFVEFFGNDWNKTYAAFRLESEKFPELTAKDGHYTKKEFTELQRLGQQYGVNVIPEIDIPAHSLAFAHYKPEIGSTKYGMDHLDLYNPETYAFVDTLLAEYTMGEQPVFIGPDLHIGTDEYDKRESEKYREFTDRYLKYVEQLGKNPRMWGGLRWLKGETPVKADNVVVNAWSYDWVDPVKSLEDGYQLISTCDSWLYIVPAAGYYRDMLDSEWLYKNWCPEMVNSKETLPKGTPGLLGGMFAVWNDHCGNGISQQDVHYRTMPAVKVLAEKLWKGENADVPYNSFEALAVSMNEAPGMNKAALYPVGDERWKSFPAFEKAEKFNGSKEILTPVPEIGFDYAVEFDLYLDKDNTCDAILFKGPESTVYIDNPTERRLSFARDGYTYHFDYTVPTKKWVALKIEGDMKGTSLFVNGKLQQRLEADKIESAVNKHGSHSYMYFQKTLFFPLQQIGDKNNGFKGKLRDLKITQKQ